MPYVDPNRRKQLNDWLNMAEAFTLNKGDLVYCVTYLVHRFVLKLGKPCFDTKSTGKSVLQDALDEYKRVVMDRHENKKRRENGSISTLDEIQLEEVR